MNEVIKMGIRYGFNGEREVKL
ncbi:MAG: hypothetical protein [Bacteriophage sp.]|nr:MAG: hypothetical protein [Bacteriophage sp.]